MRRGVAWVTQALAVVLLAGAATAEPPIGIRIDDKREVETSSGLWSTQVRIKLTTAAPAGGVTVHWSTVPGSAVDAPLATRDFVAASNTVTFSFGEIEKFIDVQINGDGDDEWTLPQTYHQDEVFFIQLDNPSLNASIQKGRATITLIDDDRAFPGLQFLAAMAGSNLTAAQNKLFWRVPAAPTQPDDILIRWNSDAGCNPPASAMELLSGADFGEGYFNASFSNTMGGALALQSWVHSGRQPNRQYCYSLFTYYGGSSFGEPMTVKITPFDATPPGEAWRYSPGCYLPCAAATLAPPTVGFEAIYTVDNHGVVHAMERGFSGGGWPSSWNPLSLGKPAQSRSPVVPMRVAPLSDWRLFIGTDGGGMHAVDGLTGALIWSRSQAFSNKLPSLPGAEQAPPAGIFVGFGGNSDSLLVGTNAGVGNNAFLRLDPYTGATLATYGDLAMGNVAGMAVADYSGTTDRVYFVTSAPGAQLVALDVPSFTLSTIPGTNPTALSSGAAGSAVLRNNRLVFGDSAGKLQGRDLAAGTSHTAEPTLDGNVKGFVWPDRRDDRIYFATDSKVQGMRETGSAFVPLWTVPVTSPSPVLQRPATDYLYVGDGNGNLVEMYRGPTPTVVSLTLEGLLDQLGSPSLDNAYGIVVVGSVNGTIHAVRVPSPF